MIRNIFSERKSSINLQYEEDNIVLHNNRVHLGPPGLQILSQLGKLEIQAVKHRVEERGEEEGRGGGGFGALEFK